MPYSNYLNYGKGIKCKNVMLLLLLVVLVCSCTIGLYLSLVLEYNV